MSTVSSCTQWCEENTWLGRLFPARGPSIVSLVGGGQGNNKMKRVLSDQLEIDDASSEHDHADDVTDRSDDTIVASHDDSITLESPHQEGASGIINEKGEEEEGGHDLDMHIEESTVDKNENKSPEQLRVDEFFAENTEESNMTPPPLMQSTMSPVKKHNSLLYEFIPVKVNLKGSIFEVASPEITEEERSLRMAEIMEDPSLLIGWQIEVFDKNTTPTTTSTTTASIASDGGVETPKSMGIRVVNGVKKMRGAAFKHNVIMEHSTSATTTHITTATTTNTTSNQSTTNTPIKAPSVPVPAPRDSLVRSPSDDEESSTSNEKWSSLKVNNTTNKAGWPFKLLRRFEIIEG